MSVIRMTEAEYQAKQSRFKPLEIAVFEKPRPKPVKLSKSQSPLEVEFLRQLRDSGLPIMEREYKPIAGRMFRLDFCWPQEKIAIECEGRVHRIKERWLADLERRNLLQLDGWIVLYVCREHIFEGQAIKWLKQLVAK